MPPENARSGQNSRRGLRLNALDCASALSVRAPAAAAAMKGVVFGVFDRESSELALRSRDVVSAAAAFRCRYLRIQLQ
jgi:hypothetical protein